MPTEFQMPKLGLTMEEGTIVEWLVEDGAEIGYDAELDASRFPFRTPSGIVVLPKGTTVPREGPVRLAFDMADLLSRDPDTRDAMAGFAGRYAIADMSRHSHMSHGHRYESND